MIVLELPVFLFLCWLDLQRSRARLEVLLHRGPNDHQTTSSYLKPSLASGFLSHISIPCVTRPGCSPPESLLLNNSASSAIVRSNFLNWPFRLTLLSNLTLYFEQEEDSTAFRSATSISSASPTTNLALFIVKRYPLGHNSDDCPCRPGHSPPWSWFLSRASLITAPGLASPISQTARGAQRTSSFL